MSEQTATVDGLMALVRDHASDCVIACRNGEGYQTDPDLSLAEWDARCDSKLAAIRAYAERLAASVAVQAAPTWIPVSERLPEDGTSLLVYTPPLRGEDERIDFEWREDGVWMEHSNCFDHYMAVTGGKGSLDDGTPCVGPSEDAPYTHWMLVPPPPEAPTEPVQRPGDHLPGGQA